MGLGFNKHLTKILIVIFAAVSILAVPFNKDSVFGYGHTLGISAVSLASTTTQDTPIDLSSSVSTVADGNIGTQPVTSYDGGSLTNVDLTNLGNIGGQIPTVGKAVTLVSSTPGIPITIASNRVSNASVVIPNNTTILAPAAWDGTITPPAAGSSTGTAPSGFSVGGSIVEVGSSTAILLFDQPIDVVLTGVTGPVGYKAAGSNAWVQITSACGGTYASPSPPVFPGECYSSNGTDTKIHTYHLTTFASLVAAAASDSSSSGSSGGSSGGGTSAPSCNDSAAGGAPALLSATAAGPNKVTLTWSKAKDPVTHYVISYGLTPGKPLYGNPNVGGKDTTSYTVGSLSGGTTYYFRVRAGNGCNGGPYSNEMAVRPAGAFVSTPAAGFLPGVLGTTKTVQEPAGEKPSQSDQPSQKSDLVSQQPKSMASTQYGGLLGSFFRFIFGFISSLFGR